MVFIPCLSFTVYGLLLHGPNYRYDVCHGFYLQADLAILLISAVSVLYIYVNMFVAVSDFNMILDLTNLSL